MRCRGGLLGTNIRFMMKCFLSWCVWMAFVLGTVSVGWSEGKESTYWKSFQSAIDRSPAEILTDYSYAGYEHGEKAIPDVQGPIFKVTQPANNVIHDDFSVGIIINWDTVRTGVLLPNAV